MANDSAFSPGGPTVLVGATAVQIPLAGSINNVQSYRVRCLVAAYLTWGPSTVTAAGAPTAGVPSANTIGMAAGAVEKLSLPDGNTWFIASAAAAFEVTPGEGI